MRVELQDVGVELGGRTLVRGADLVCEPGRLTVIVGHSGTGLTTLLKVAAGLHAPTRGRVVHDGDDLGALAGDARRRQQARTGFVFQDAALWANQSLRANLELPLQATDPRLPENARRERIDAALAACSWSPLLAARPVTLSRGEQQLLGYLRAVLPRPDALFLDEPFALLDHHWRDCLVADLARQRDRGVTLLMTCRDRDRAHALGDVVVELTGGGLRAATTASQREGGAP